MKDVLTRWEGVDMTRSKLDLSFACIGFEAEATRAKERSVTSSILPQVKVSPTEEIEGNWLRVLRQALQLLISFKSLQRVVVDFF